MSTTRRAGSSSLAAITVLGVLAFGTSAEAQTARAGSGATPAAPAAGAPAAGAPAADGTQVTVQNQGGRRVYVAAGVIEVRGEIQRPYAFSLSGRASLGYSYLEVPVHFVQEIINAVRRAPF